MPQNIIIVGNGTSLLDKKNGRLIDSFDIVVRFNSYKIKNYEQHTGIKTNIWFTVNKSHLSEIKNFNRVIEHCWIWNEEKDLLYQELLLEYPNCEKVSENFVKTKVPVNNPSTGLIAIFFFLEEGYKNIFITGFDWWEREKHHYGDNEIRGTLHKPMEEYKIIKKLINDKKIRFL
jgi:hypothetical protein